VLNPITLFSTQVLSERSHWDASSRTVLVSVNSILRSEDMEYFISRLSRLMEPDGDVASAPGTLPSEHADLFRQESYTSQSQSQSQASNYLTASQSNGIDASDRSRPFRPRTLHLASIVTATADDDDSDWDTDDRTSHTDKTARRRATHAQKLYKRPSFDSSSSCSIPSIQSQESGTVTPFAPEVTISAPDLVLTLPASCRGIEKTQKKKKPGKEEKMKSKNQNGKKESASLKWAKKQKAQGNKSKNAEVNSLIESIARKESSVQSTTSIQSNSQSQSQSSDSSRTVVSVSTGTGGADSVSTSSSHEHVECADNHTDGGGDVGGRGRGKVRATPSESPTSISRPSPFLTVATRALTRSLSASFRRKHKPSSEKPTPTESEELDSLR